MEFSLCFWALLTVKYGRFFTLVLFGHMDEKKVEKFDPEKRLDFRVGSNWLILWLLNFEGCQLWHQLSQAFLHQFFKFLCPSCCKIPEFSKTPPTSYIWMNLKEVVTKNQKNKKSEKCQFEPTLKCYHFSGWHFSTFFASLCPKSTKVKNRPYLTVKGAKKQQENS